MDFIKNGVRYTDIRTRKKAAIPTLMNLDIEDLYFELGQDEFVKFINSCLQRHGVEIEIKKKGGKNNG